MTNGDGREAEDRRKRIGMAIRVVIAVGLLGLAVWTNRKQLDEVFRNSVDGPLFFGAFLLYLCASGLAYVRWYLLVRAVGLPFRLVDGIRLGLIGTLFNFVIPGAIGGDFVRAAFLCREQSRRTEPIASVVVDRLVGLIGLFLIAAIVGTLGADKLGPNLGGLIRAAWIATGVTMALLGLCFVIRPGRPGRRFTRVRGELAAVGLAYRKHLRIVALGVVMGVGTHTLNVTAFYVASCAIFSNVPSYAEHLLIVPLVLFSTGIPLPFGAVGVTEQVSLALFRLTQYSGGGVAMMAFRVMQLGNASIGAVAYLANPAQVRALADSAKHLDEELLEEEATVGQGV